MKSTRPVSSDIPIEVLKAMGYAIVSRKYCQAARLDRPDWYEYMVKVHRYAAPRYKEQLQSQYRRVFSRDIIQVPSAYVGVLPNSDGFVDKRPEAVIGKDRVTEFATHNFEIINSIQPPENHFALNFSAEAASAEVVVQEIISTYGLAQTLHWCALAMEDIDSNQAHLLRAVADNVVRKHDVIHLGKARRS
jgi:hypothetical protein